MSQHHVVYLLVPLAEVDDALEVRRVSRLASRRRLRRLGTGSKPVELGGESVDLRLLLRTNLNFVLGLSLGARALTVVLLEELAEADEGLLEVEVLALERLLAILEALLLGAELSLLLIESVLDLEHLPALLEEARGRVDVLEDERVGSLPRRGGGSGRGRHGSSVRSKLEEGRGREGLSERSREKGRAEDAAKRCADTRENATVGVARNPLRGRASRDAMCTPAGDPRALALENDARRNERGALSVKANPGST